MYATLGIVEPELVGLARKALTWDATGRLRFAVYATSWLYFMVVHGRRRRRMRHFSRDDTVLQ